jgi:hypothetical protein
VTDTRTAIRRQGRSGGNNKTDAEATHMSGVQHSIIPRTKYSFDNIAVATTFSFPIARYIDVSQYREATLMVRVHARNIVATGTIKVEVLGDAPTSDDPAQDFQTGVQGTSTSIVAGTTSPSVQLQTIPANIGGMISVWLTVTQGTSASTLNAKISIDISLKS